MNDIVIPLKVGNVGTVQNQLMVVGRQLASLQNGAMVGNGRSGNSSGSSGTSRIRNPPASLSQRLQNAVNTSRFSMSNGKVNFSPLVGRTAAVFGKLSTAATVLTGVVGMLSNATRSAVETMTSFRQAQLTSGGTAAQTAQMGSMGSSLGMSSQEISQMSREFGQKIASDGVAAGYASRAGIRDLGDVFGDPNKANNILKWAKYLDTLSDVEATRAARATGTEELLPYRDLSSQTKKQLEEDAKIRAQYTDPSMTKQAAEFNAQLSRLKNNFETAKMALGQPLIELGAWAMEKIANGLGASSDLRKGSAFDPNSRAGQRKSEVKENTEATKELNKTMQGFFKNGTYGGGERARGAMPKQWTGMSADQWANAIGGLGPFNL